MQSLIHNRDPSHITLGERRGKSDLARFSLDSSWPSAVSDTRYWAYPSPPMSGSPPIPPRRNPDFEDRGQGSFEARRPDVSQSGRASLEGQGDVRSQMQSFRSFPEPYRPVPYSYQQASRQPGQPQFEQQQPQQSQQPQQQQQQPPQQIAPLQSYASMHMHQPQTNLQPATSERSSIDIGYQTPKAQRKTKGHVASACVPCKRAHLRCDAQRPCSRCMSNGKEEACIDVQHKKRGRPRLRDEREPRYESFGPAYRPPPQAEPSMRRPLSMYAPGDVQTASAYPDPVHRSSTYRVLKSQGETSSMARHMDFATMRDVNLYAGGGPSTPSTPAMAEVPLAYLTMDLSFVKSTQSFSDAVLPGILIISRKLLDLVTASDRDKVYRLQQTLEEERREREPNYLPPIFGRSDEEIQSVGLGMGEATQIRTNRQEILTFQMPDGQQRTFEVRIGLAKKDSTYFVVMMLPSVPQAPPQSPFFREPQYAFRAPQPGFSQPMAPSPSFPYPPTMYHQTGATGQVVPRQVPNMPTYTQPNERSDYSQVHRPMQTPRSELPQRPQHELQLPPIRTQGSAIQGSGQQRSEGAGRGQDYVGGLERPNEGGRRY